MKIATEIKRCLITMINEVEKKVNGGKKWKIFFKLKLLF